MGKQVDPDEVGVDELEDSPPRRVRVNLDELTSAHEGDVSYDRTECCGCEGYCRCTLVVNIRLNSLDIPNFVESVIPEELHHTIIGYCAERMLRYTGACDKDNWSVQIHDGYYGQEVGGLLLNHKIASAAADHIRRVIAFHNDASRMEHILKLEYGYLLPTLQERKWMIDQVRRDDVVIGQGDHYHRKLDGKLIAEYKDHPFPVAVCVAIARTYRLIDGFHRFSSTEGEEEVTVVLASQ